MKFIKLIHQPPICYLLHMKTLFQTSIRALAAGRRAKAYHQGAMVWGDSQNADIVSTNSDSVTMRAYGGFRFFTGAATGAQLPPGGGSWASMSDRNSKQAFQPVDSADVLEKLAALPIESWQYKEQDAAVRHVGPVAQDFHAAFGFGESDRYLTSCDVDGIAFLAIQELYQENQELKKRMAEMEKALQDLRK